MRPCSMDPVNGRTVYRVRGIARTVDQRLKVMRRSTQPALAEVRTSTKGSSSGSGNSFGTYTGAMSFSSGKKGHSSAGMLVVPKDTVRYAI